jgi:endonuclease I
MHYLFIRLKLWLVLILLFLGVSGQIPAGYYDAAAGLHGFALKTALYNIIHTHTELPYSNLYSYYAFTDSKTGNVVWDMYSDIPGGTPAYIYHYVPADECGSYVAEGDCFNREHTIPSSWFNDGTPMYSDLFNVVPTDGYVNNKRGNFPHAKVGSTSWTSTNGSKLGNCVNAGYSSTVFEPIDEYKGDFARAYLYMVTCYENVVAGWASNSGANVVLAANDSSVFLPWYINVLLSWNASDTVSSKEIARNDSVYKYQHNRNPYIDHPEWVNKIWAYVAGMETINPRQDKTNVYPNPAKDKINISSSAGETINNIYFCDLTGRKIAEKDQINSSTFHIDVSNLQRGLYFLFVVSNDDRSCFPVILN